MSILEQTSIAIEHSRLITKEKRRQTARHRFYEK